MSTRAGTRGGWGGGGGSGSLALLDLARPLRVLFLGDSYVQRPSLDAAAGLRYPCWESLASRGLGDFTFIGTQIGGFPRRYGLGSWRFGGGSGLKIEAMIGEDEIANADIICFSAGINNVLAGDTGATMLAALAACFTAIELVNPTVRLLVTELSTLVSPEASAPRAAAVAAFNAGLAAAVSPYGGRYKVVTHGNFPAYAMNSDGIHPIARAIDPAGVLWADSISKLTAGRGAAVPRRPAIRASQSSVYLGHPLSDRITIPYAAHRAPSGADSFGWSLAFFPTGLQSEGVLWQYADDAADGAVVHVSGADLVVSLKGDILAIVEDVLEVGRWHEIAVGFDAEAEALRVFCTPQGVENMLGGGSLVHEVAIDPWSITVDETTRIGYTAADEGITGLVARYAFCAGYAPTIHDANGIYYAGALPAGTTSYFPLHAGQGTVLVDTEGGADGTLVTTRSSTVACWSPEGSTENDPFLGAGEEAAVPELGALATLRAAGVLVLDLDAGASEIEAAKRMITRRSANADRVGRVSREVREWTDGSSRGLSFRENGALPVLLSRSPINGQLALEAGGTDGGSGRTLGPFANGSDTIAFTDLAITNAWTFFAVVELYASDVTDSNHWELPSVIVDDAAQFTIGFDLLNVVTGTRDGGFPEASTPIVLGEPLVITSWLTGGQMSVRCNGTSSAGTAVGTVTQLDADDGSFVKLFYSGNNTQKFMQGRCFGIWGTNTALSAPQRAAVEAELKARFRPGYLT